MAEVRENPLGKAPVSDYWAQLRKFHVTCELMMKGRLFQLDLPFLALIDEPVHGTYHQCPADDIADGDW